MAAPAEEKPSEQRAAQPWGAFRLARVYTILSVGMSGTWQKVLDHFLRTLQLATEASGQGGLEVHVLQYDTTAGELASEMGVQAQQLPLEGSYQGGEGEQLAVEKLAGSMSRDRWEKWHTAILYKTESWAEIAGDPRNEGLPVLCADADHTFFPGFPAVVEDCLSRHDLCFEANFISAGTPLEAGELAHDVPRGTPDKSFWSSAFINTGLFAMRCNQATAGFWNAIAGLMRWSYVESGAASDQDAAIVMLRDFQSDLNWGVLNPYAVNQLSEQALRGTRPPGPHLRKLLSSMVAHHAVYTNPDCQHREVESCKLALMQLANATWFALRSSAGADVSARPLSLLTA